MATDNQTGWHLDKKVPISIILALLTQGVMGLWFIADIKKDVEVLKAQLLVQRDRDDRQDRTAGEAMTLVRQQLERVEAKLDRLIEKGNK